MVISEDRLLEVIKVRWSCESGLDLMGVMFLRKGHKSAPLATPQTLTMWEHRR